MRAWLLQARDAAAALARRPPLLSRARSGQRVTGANAIPASASCALDEHQQHRRRRRTAAFAGGCRSRPGAGPPRRRGGATEARRSVGRSSSERRGDVVLAQPQRRGAQQAAIVAPSRPGSAEQQSALPTPRCCSRPKLSGAPALTAPAARRSRCRRAIVPTAASRRCLCHEGSRPHAAGPTSAIASSDRGRGRTACVRDDRVRGRVGATDGH